MNVEIEKVADRIIEAIKDDASWADRADRYATILERYGDGDIAACCCWAFAYFSDRLIDYRLNKAAETELDEQAKTDAAIMAACREMTVCPACDSEKSVGMLVCWTCFKGQSPDPTVAPLKYAEMPLVAWLRAVGSEVVA